MSPEVRFLWILLRGHVARTHDDERGVSAVEWVLITLALIGLAGAVTAIIVTRVQNRAQDISL